MTNIFPATDFLLEKRFYKEVVDNIPESMYPKSESDAYEVQRQIVSHLLFHNQSSVCGYKLACTNDSAKNALGVDGPFSGCMLSHSTYSNGRSLVAEDFVLRIVEQEFAFMLDQDVPFPGTPYTAETVKPFIGALIPAIEVVDHRYTDFTKVGKAALIADNAIHGVSILGERNNDWKHLDLSTCRTQLFVNDKLAANGSGENVLGNPLNAVSWITNHLQSRGIELKAGNFITTGTTCDVYLASAGDQIKADFGELGSVSTSFE
ncbi:MAG: hypothetical protein GKR96_10870 [Gammaproteobacteria bacterium]|nr:hypothetical protein [Gammaproteobacteria bacterium]